MSLQLTLWDWLTPIARAMGMKPPGGPPSPPRQKAGGGKVRGRAVDRENAQAAPEARVTGEPAASMKPARREARRGEPRTATPREAGVQARYDEVVHTMLARYNIRVRKWRTSMSGVAWRLDYRDGRSVNLLESPRPKGPMSMAVFLHEVGHHAIGLGVHKPRCLEEYLAWKWSLDTMASEGLNITEAVRYRMALSLWYAVSKAHRRGLRELPAELLAYVERPVRAGRPERNANRAGLHSGR